MTETQARIGRLTADQLTNNGSWIERGDQGQILRYDPRYYEQLNEFTERHRREWHEKHDPKYQPKGKK